MDKSLRWYHWGLIGLLVAARLPAMTESADGGPFLLLGAAIGAAVVVWVLTMAVRLGRIWRSGGAIDADAAE